MATDDPKDGEDVTTGEARVEDLDPLLGVTLDGRFRLVGAIGKGAMGTVYRAVQVPLNRAVALKVLDSNFGAGREASFRQRFLVEAALTAKLQHPNTVRIIDYGCTPDGIFYLAMEYLDGQTLDRVLAKGALPWRRALSIAQQVARALREAHELGVVHRDLKPANVMLLSADDDTEYVKVLDFGLVKSFVEGQELEGRAVTQQGMLVGSPPYMAPEQGDSNVADPRSDLYSLGVVLFEMLSGKVPFSGTQPLEIIVKHVREPVPRLAAPPGFDAVPPELEAIVRRCLAKSPMDRYQTMDELLQALAELVGTGASRQQLEPVAAVSQPIVRQGIRPAWLAVAFALALGAGGALTWALVPKPKPTVQVVTVPVPTDPDERLAPPPTQIVFHVETEPAGASVFYKGKLLGVTPLDFPVDNTGQDNTSVELVLKKDGYLPLSVKSGGSGPRIELSQKLQRIPAPPPPPPAPVEKPAKVTKPAKKSAAKLDEEDEPPPKSDLKRPKP
jgi:serine/threonine-protein kinase